ncbi:MAG TPA: ABC transporter permease [Vicinamibacterales bacterium]|jgi:predicted permease
MHTILSDLRYGVRTLASTPGFTAVAVLILGIGIGLNTAVFSLTNMILLRPLSGESKPGQLAALYAYDRTHPDSYHEFSYPAYVDIRDRNGVFAQTAGLAVTMVGLGEGEMTRRGFAFIATSSLFTLFDARPPKGRAFLPDEETPGANRLVTVLSEEYWRRSGADPNIVGKTIRINTQPFTVVGVAPRGFGGPTTMIAPAVWLPTGVYDLVAGNGFRRSVKRAFADRAEETLLLFARMRPGVSFDSAQAPLTALAGQLEQAFPAEHRHLGLKVRSISRTGISTNPQNDGDAYTMSGLLQGVTAIVLVIACMNLANMLLARSTSRRREIAVRFALGANRVVVVRQLLIEGFVLSLAGSAVGLLFTYWALRAFGVSLDPLSELMIVLDPRPDLRILGVALGFAVFATLTFCLGPSLQLLRTDVFGELKEGARAAATGRHRYVSMRHVLVVGQVALSLALLTAAGLFVRGATKAAHAEPGFALDRSVVVGVDPSLTRIDEKGGRDFYRRALDRLRATPGIEAASMASIVPFGNMSETRRVRFVGQPVADVHADNELGGSSTSYGAGGGDGGGNDRNGVTAAFYVVGRDYFQTLRIPILRGRGFTETEESDATGPRVAVIDEPMAKRLFKGADPIGQHVYMPDPVEAERAPMEVVGIVAGTRHSMFDTTPGPHIFVPFGQRYRSTMTFHARVASSGPAAEAVALHAIREQLRGVDSSIPIVLSSNMADFRDHGMSAWGVRMGAQMFAAFGIVAAFLALIGIYGVRAYLVARRTREIGIRMALGATRADVLRMVLREGMVLVSVGLVIGVFLAFAAGMSLRGMIYQVSEYDPASFVGAAVLLSLTALVACYVPALRATKVAPTVALRSL